MVDHYEPRTIVWRGDYFTFGVVINVANDDQADASGGVLNGKVFRLNAEECKWTYKSDKKGRNYGSPDGKGSRFFMGKVTEELEFSNAELHGFLLDLLHKQRTDMVDATIVIYANSTAQASMVQVARLHKCVLEEFSGNFKNNEEFTGTFKFSVKGESELVNPSMADESLTI